MCNYGCKINADGFLNIFNNELYRFIIRSPFDGGHGCDIDIGFNVYNIVESEVGVRICTV